MVDIIDSAIFSGNNTCLVSNRYFRVDTRHNQIGQCRQIEACLQVLLELDQSLKSQPVEEQILLETALCRLAMAGSGR